ncbi:MAG: hypothetical protein HY791_31975 [Deltaproteobacteria bacterium]|nr:hypothetical protein [Deltaproteobacteria bacterium]
MLSRSKAHIVVALTLAGCSTERTRAATDPCQSLLSCCRALESTDRGLALQCQANYDELRGRQDARTACPDALAQLRSAGACAAQLSDAGSSEDSGAPPTPDAGPVTSHELCDAYVECTSHTAPEGLGVILATYGPAGSCWSSASEGTCSTACLTGLQHARQAHPGELSCPACFSDLDCAGSSGGPACDRVSGRCVECNEDPHCSGSLGACRAQSHTCVECTSATHCPAGTCDVSRSSCTTCIRDSDCPSARPHCVATSGQPVCEECVRSSDCSSNSCSNGSCCEPESCGELKAGRFFPSSLWLCGANVSDRCSPTVVDCGPCPRGDCVPMESDSRFRYCSTQWTPCDPRTSGACLEIEKCTYVPNRNGYVCAWDLTGSVCVYGGSSYSCGDNSFSCDGANLVNDGVCVPYCLVNQDCPSNRCTFYSELGYGTCSR